MITTAYIKNIIYEDYSSAIVRFNFFMNTVSIFIHKLRNLFLAPLQLPLLADFHPIWNVIFASVNSSLQ